MMDMEADILMELQGNRPRSRTWPLPQPEDLAEVDKSPQVDEENGVKLDQNTKKSSRKNAWGNMSYADLITQAISSSPEQRMTLSQIYSWMVENIPYFKDKGDSTSSAGWKNSIRHNLSLHSRFMRIQNEGNGKSSWWILNHDAKAEKTKRRSRSSSLDSEAGGPKLKNKRGRKATKIRVEGDERPQSPKCASRSALTPKSPTGEPSVIIEDNPYPFALADYRTRSSSNTSNVSSLGRLSPIHDEDEMSISTMSPAEQGKTTPVGGLDELMDNMKENLSMAQQGQVAVEMKGSPPFDQNRALNNNNSIAVCNTDDSTNIVVQAMNIDSPSSFVDARSPYATPRTNADYRTFNSQMKIHQPKCMYPDQTSGIMHSGNGLYNQRGLVNGRSSPFTSLVEQRSSVAAQQRISPQPFNRQPPSYNQALRFNNCFPKQKEQQTVFHNNYMNTTNGGHPSESTPNVPMISIEMADKLPVDIDVDFLEGDIECDVENVLRRELAFNDGYLDFNLDNYVPSIALPEVPMQTYISGSMVH